MRLFFPIAKVDAEQRMVWGYASTEARDEQGEIVAKGALEAALGDYMKFANIREMHQLSAVGVAQEAAVDEKGLYLGAKIVDERAWAKIVAGVYKGFSIGGRVTERAAGDPNTITALVLSEISLVDRPANPEAIFDYWKAASGGEPVQIWTCGEGGHRHFAKAEALRCLDKRAGAGDSAGGEPAPPAAAAQRAVDYADPGYRQDGKPRYPIDTEEHIRAAWAYINRPDNAGRYTPVELARIRSRILARWKEVIDPNGPPAAARGKSGGGGRVGKQMMDGARLADLIDALAWLQDGAASLVRGGSEEDAAQSAQIAMLAEALSDCLAAVLGAEGEDSDPDDGEDSDQDGDADPGAGSGERALDLIAAALRGHGGRTRPSGLAKTLVAERTEKTALVKALAAILPRLDALQKRVEDIARQPLPPKTMARSLTAVAKGAEIPSATAAPDSAALAAALAGMSRDDQTLTLIKAAQMNPIPGSGFGPAPRGGG